MNSDASFDSEAENSESDKEINETKEDEKLMENLDIIKSIFNSLSTILEENKKLSNLQRNYYKTK